MTDEFRERLAQRVSRCEPPPAIDAHIRRAAHAQLLQHQQTSARWRGLAVRMRSVSFAVRAAALLLFASFYLAETVRFAAHL